MRAILTYALLRAALFVAPFAILVAAQVEWYVALVVALLFAFAASYVFLRRFKEAAVAEIARTRAARGTEADEDVEDGAVDAERSTGTTAAEPTGTARTDVEPDERTDR